MFRSSCSSDLSLEIFPDFKNRGRYGCSTMNDAGGEVLHLNPNIPLGIPIFNAGDNLVSQMERRNMGKRFNLAMPKKGVISDA